MTLARRFLLLAVAAALLCAAGTAFAAHGPLDVKRDDEAVRPNHIEVIGEVEETYAANVLFLEGTRPSAYRIGVLVSSADQDLFGKTLSADSASAGYTFSVNNASYFREAGDLYEASGLITMTLSSETSPSRTFSINLSSVSGVTPDGNTTRLDITPRAVSFITDRGNEPVIISKTEQSESVAFEVRASNATITPVVWNRTIPYILSGDNRPINGRVKLNNNDLDDDCVYVSFNNGTVSIIGGSKGLGTPGTYRIGLVKPLEQIGLPTANGADIAGLTTRAGATPVDADVLASFVVTVDSSPTPPTPPVDPTGAQFNVERNPNAAWPNNIDTITKIGDGNTYIANVYYLAKAASSDFRIGVLVSSADNDLSGASLSADTPATGGYRLSAIEANRFTPSGQMYIASGMLLMRPRNTTAAPAQFTVKLGSVKGGSTAMINSTSINVTPRAVSINPGRDSVTISQPSQSETVRFEMKASNQSTSDVVNWNGTRAYILGPSGAPLTQIDLGGTRLNGSNDNCVTVSFDVTTCAVNLTAGSDNIGTSGTYQIAIVKSPQSAGLPTINSADIAGITPGNATPTSDDILAKFDVVVDSQLAPEPAIWLSGGGIYVHGFDIDYLISIINLDKVINAGSVTIDGKFIVANIDPNDPSLIIIPAAEMEALGTDRVHTVTVHVWGRKLNGEDFEGDLSAELIVQPASPSNIVVYVDALAHDDRDAIDNYENLETGVLYTADPSEPERSISALAADTQGAFQHYGGMQVKPVFNISRNDRYSVVIPRGSRIFNIGSSGGSEKYLAIHFYGDKGMELPSWAFSSQGSQMLLTATIVVINADGQPVYDLGRRGAPKGIVPISDINPSTQRKIFWLPDRDHKVLYIWDGDGSDGTKAEFVVRTKDLPGNDSGEGGGGGCDMGIGIFALAGLAALIARRRR